MKYIVLALLLMGCGKESIQYVTEQSEPVIGGYYILDGPSDANCIYIANKSPTLVDIETDCQNLLTINPENNSIGQFPIISATNLVVLNNEIRHSRNISYTSGNDIEEDVSGSNITGTRRTDIFINMIDGKLRIKMSIYQNANNNNVNNIVAERVFNER